MEVSTRTKVVGVEVTGGGVFGTCARLRRRGRAWRWWRRWWLQFRARWRQRGGGTGGTHLGEVGGNHSTIIFTAVAPLLLLLLRGGGGSGGGGGGGRASVCVDCAVQVKVGPLFRIKVISNLEAVSAVVQSKELPASELAAAAA